MSAFGDDVKKLREVAAQQDEMHKAVRDRDEAIGGEGTGGGGRSSPVTVRSQAQAR